MAGNDVQHLESNVGQDRQAPARCTGLGRPRRTTGGRVARRGLASAASGPTAPPVAGRPLEAGPSRRQAQRVAAATPPARRRVTRRGRLLVVVLAAVLLLAAFSLGRVSSNASSDNRPTTTHVTVHPGETMWQVAVRVAPDNDPRVTVQRLMRLNHMTTPELRAGQSLVVPVG